MKSFLNFSLNLDHKEQENVLLHIEGSTPIKMNVLSQSKPNNFIYEAKLPISPSCEFPKSLVYNYIINGAYLYQSNQNLVISKQPLSSTLNVNDTKMQKDGTNYINITFYIHIPSNISNNLLFLMSDSPAFVIGEQVQSSFRLQQLQDSHMWAATAQISSFLNQPIIYKYLICDTNGTEISKESGKPHVLFIHSPIAYKNIVVYDVWFNYIPSLSFYPHLVKPSEVQALKSSVKIEYIPSYKSRNVYIRSQMFEDQDMFPENGVWRRDLELPSTFENFTFDLGTVYDPNSGKINWESDPIYKIHHPYKNVKQDQYVSNLFYGNAFNDKLIGIYIPLVSIVSDSSRSVGDFTSLVNISKWCKQCGIDILNVHVEQIEGGLIDPIHSNIRIENESSIFEREPAQNKMNAIRNAKLLSLWNKFNSWEKNKDKEFELFTTCNPMITEKCANNDFSLFVQYTLFKDFSIAFANIVDIGIQLILDIDMSSDLMDHITTYSHYAQGLRIVGLSQYINLFTVGDVKQLFDPTNDNKMFNFFMQNFCTLDTTIKPSSSSDDDQPIVLFKTCYSEDFLQSVENIHKTDPEFISKLDILKGKYQNSKKCKILINNLSKIAPDCPSSILLDNEATMKLGEHNAKSMNLIPCSQSKNNIVPNFLSPEKVSEFDENTDAASEINKKINSNAKLVIIYFLDFLKAMSKGENDLNINVKPIQLIKKYCRFSFGLSVDDLMKNQKLNQKIQETLYSTKQM